MDYLAAIEQLNTEQRSAVEQTEGVVMVVAGPGTGKTQMLSARVAHLIKNQNVEERAILCLTFTDAATNALRERLFSFVGASAHRVGIYTYHGFCNLIIQEHKDIFGWNDLNPATDLDLLQLMQELIDELPLNHKLKRLKGDVYYDQKRLKDLFDLMKKEYLNVQEILDLISQHLRDIELDENFRYKRNSGENKKGDLNRKYYEEIEKMSKLEAAVQLFPLYQQKLTDHRLYDFNDMILWVIQLFQENPHIAGLYQEQIEHLLVDEYQDTNGAQNELISLLLGQKQQPNVFVVGDDDQSIYKFQGANVTNITDFYSRYAEHLKLVVLDKNYRSNQEILDSASALIDHNNERLVSQLEGISKDLKSEAIHASNVGLPVQIRSYENSFQESVAIAAEIQNLYEQGVKYHEIAVLYRNHKEADDLLSYFSSKAIPHQLSRTQDVLETSIVDQFLKLLRYLQFESKKLDLGSSLLFELLHFRNFKSLNALEISKLALVLRQDKDRGWREKIHEYCQGDEGILKAASKEELNSYIQDIERWLKEMHELGLESLFIKLMEEGNFLKAAIDGPEPLFEIQCLKSLHGLLKDECSKIPSLNLDSFLQTIELLKSSGLGLKMNKITHAKEGVQFMTAHASKGLEFDHVFIISATSNTWEARSRALPFGFGSLIPPFSQESQLEEARRLFYVAMTRARKSINISYPEQNEKGKSLSKCSFVAELQEYKPSLWVKEEVEDQALLNFFEGQFSSATPEFIQLSSHEFIDQRLQGFKLSPSNLNAYLNCPIAFFYQNILGIPQASSESMIMGSAVHRGLEVFFKQTDSSTGWTFPDSSVAVDAYEQHILKNQERFSKHSLQRSLDWGKQHIPEYIDHWLPTWSRYDNVETELNMEQLEHKAVPIHGQIDKLILTDAQAIVVDYKTGKYQYAQAKLKAAKPLTESSSKEDELGGDYWRQLVFYKILMDASSFNHNVELGIIDFIEKHKETFKSEMFEIRKQDVEVVGNQIVETYKNIMAKKFDQGCEEERCEWCKFNREILGRRHEYEQLNEKAQME